MTIQGRVRRIRRKLQVYFTRKVQDFRYSHIYNIRNRIARYTTDFLCLFGTYDNDGAVRGHHSLFYPYATFWHWFLFYTAARVLWAWPFGWHAEDGLYGPLLMPSKLLLWDIPVAYLAYKAAIAMYKTDNFKNPWPHIFLAWSYRAYDGLRWSLMINWYLAHTEGNGFTKSTLMHHHRLDGPSNIEITNGKLAFKSWNYYNEPHRFDGYALIATRDDLGRRREDRQEYWLFGLKLTPEQYERYVANKPRVAVAVKLWKNSRRFSHDQYRRKKFRANICRWLREHGQRKIVKTMRAAARLRR